MGKKNYIQYLVQYVNNALMFQYNSKLLFTKRLDYKSLSATRLVANHISYHYEIYYLPLKYCQ